MSSFQDIVEVFRLQLPWRQKPKGFTRSRPRTEREPVLRRLLETSLGFCLRVIVNEKPLNLNEATSSVLSVFNEYFQTLFFTEIFEKVKDQV